MGCVDMIFTSSSYSCSTEQSTRTTLPTHKYRLDHFLNSACGHHQCNITSELCSYSEHNRLNKEPCFAKS